MKLIYDCHTHTNFSHGKATASEMIKEAHRQGLSGIYITEHGYAHYYAKKLNREKYLQLKHEIERMKNLYPEMDIRFGVEANIVSTEGRIDIEDDIDIFDFINAGFHVMIKMDNVKSYTNLFLPSLIAQRIKNEKIYARVCRSCTDAAIKMLDRYDINMITHPTSNYPMFIDELAQKCAQTGTLLEINNSRQKLDAKQLAQAAQTPGVQFAVGSDAHIVSNVGSCSRAFEIIQQSGVSTDRIVNVVQ